MINEVGEYDLAGWKGINGSRQGVTQIWTRPGITLDIPFPFVFYTLFIFFYIFYFRFSKIRILRAWHYSRHSFSLGKLYIYIFENLFYYSLLFAKWHLIHLQEQSFFSLLLVFNIFSNIFICCFQFLLVIGKNLLSLKYFSVFVSLSLKKTV